MPSQPAAPGQLTLNGSQRHALDAWQFSQRLHVVAGPVGLGRGAQVQLAANMVAQQGHLSGRRGITARGCWAGGSCRRSGWSLHLRAGAACAIGGSAGQDSLPRVWLAAVARGLRRAVHLSRSLAIAVNCPLSLPQLLTIVISSGPVKFVTGLWEGAGRAVNAGGHAWLARRSVGMRACARNVQHRHARASRIARATAETPSSTAPGCLNSLPAGRSSTHQVPGMVTLQGSSAGGRDLQDGRSSMLQAAAGTPGRRSTSPTVVAAVLCHLPVEHVNCLHHGLLCGARVVAGVQWIPAEGTGGQPGDSQSLLIQHVSRSPMMCAPRGAMRGTAPGCRLAA